MQTFQLKASLCREDEVVLGVTADAGAPCTGDDVIEVASRSCHNIKNKVSGQYHSSGGSDGGIGVVGWTHSGARRVLAARVSKLARAEADAYADVRVCMCVCVFI